MRLASVPEGPKHLYILCAKLRGPPFMQSVMCGQCCDNCMTAGYGCTASGAAAAQHLPFSASRVCVVRSVNSTSNCPTPSKSCLACVSVHVVAPYICYYSDACLASGAVCFSYSGLYRKAWLAKAQPLPFAAFVMKAAPFLQVLLVNNETRGRLSQYTPTAGVASAPGVTRVYLEMLRPHSFLHAPRARLRKLLYKQRCVRGPAQRRCCWRRCCCMAWALVR